MTMVTLLVGQATAFAANAPLELRWSELSTAVTGKTVEMVLPGAVTVKGEVAAIREDALVLDVHKSSDNKAQPKGNAVIPRASVSVIKIEEHGTNWRTMGTVVGAIGGLPLGGYIAAKTTDSAGAGIAIFAVVASVATLAGRMAGGNVDRRVKMIRVLP
ncbi:MAG: hypothetical protein ABL995_13540 [Bryobacteraceae bacterium]